MTTAEIVLPADRRREGRLRLIDDTGDVLDVRCLGKADNATAAKHGNPHRSPLRPYGDTPTGEYLVTAIRRYDPLHASFGARFIALEPIGGDALTAKQNGRAGLAIHDDDVPPADGTLRVTYGCVRVDTPAAVALAARLMVDDRVMIREGDAA